MFKSQIENLELFCFVLYVQADFEVNLQTLRERKAHHNKQFLYKNQCFLSIYSSKNTKNFTISYL